MARESHPLPPPSWPTVIATTLRLWMQRHVFHARQKAPGFRHSPAITAIVAIVVIAAAAAAFAIAKATDASSSPGPSEADQRSNSRALAAAAASREHAAAWVAAQVSHGVIVGCDPLTCAALQQDGFPPADLAQIGASASDPLGAGVVISTLAVRSQLGANLAKVYAPDIIASFGTGSSLVQVRVVTPGGAAAYGPAERADLLARQTAGSQLVLNSNIDAPAAAKAELASGRVDSRVLITLAALAARFRIQIQAFGDAGPGAGSASPLRQLTVISPSTTYLDQLLAFLNAQRPPLLATVSAHSKAGTTIVQIQFTAPSPTGLLPGSAAQ